MDGRYVTISTSQNITGGKTFTATLVSTNNPLERRMKVDTSNYETGLIFTNKAGATRIAEIGFHNTANRLFIIPKTVTSGYDDKVGNYALKIGVNELTYNTNTIWHAGNANLTSVPWRVNQLSFPEAQFNMTAAPRTTINPMTLKLWDSYGQKPVGNEFYGTVLEIYGKPSHWDIQLYFEAGRNNLYIRQASYNTNTWAGWSKFALTTDNVASATKLQTARTIWGQGFDGTQNVSGDMVGVGYINSGFKVERLSDGTRLFLTGGHSVEFNGWTTGYAHMNYYFLPRASVNGTTQAQVFIQNYGTSSGTATTTHAFYADGRAVHASTVATTGIRFTNTGAFNLDAYGNPNATTNTDTSYWQVQRYDKGSALRIYASTGNVNVTTRLGVGQATPAFPLDVTGNARFTKMIAVESPNNENPSTLTQVWVSNGSDNWLRKASWTYFLAKLTNNTNTLDLRSLNANTWYPCHIKLSSFNRTTIKIWVSLQGNKPSWATHSSGFTLNLCWTATGSQWGTTTVQRTIWNGFYNYAPSNPCGGIEQNTMSSDEIVYLRGGAVYYYWADSGTTFTINSNGYVWHSGTPDANGNYPYNYTAPTRTSIKSDTSRDFSTSRISASYIDCSQIWGLNSVNVDNWTNVLNGAAPYNMAGGDYQVPIGYSRNLMRWQDRSPSGYRTQYVIGSRRPNTSWGCMTLSVGNSDAGTSGYQLCIWGTGELSWGGSYVNFPNGRIALGWDGAGSKGISCVGNIYAQGAITAKQSSSDIRLKKDIQSYDALSIIRRFRSVKYRWNESAKKNTPIFNNDYDQFGLIAQDLLAGGFNQWVKDIFKDYYTIDYERLIPPLWRGLQQVDDEVTLLKKRIEVLEEVVKNLGGQVPV